MNSKFKKVLSKIVCAGLFALFAVPSFHAGKLDTLLRLYCLQTNPSYWDKPLSVSDRIIGNPEEPHIEIVLDGRGEGYSKSDTKRMKKTVYEWANMGFKHKDIPYHFEYRDLKSSQDVLEWFLGRTSEGVMDRNNVLKLVGECEIQCAIRNGEGENIGFLLIDIKSAPGDSDSIIREFKTLEEINNANLVEELRFSIFIAPEYRNTGIGSNVIKMFIESIEQKKTEDENIKYLFAVKEGNKASIRMLEHVSSGLGDKFTTTDERKYNQDHWEHLTMISAKS
jgi:hypothetical protein